MVPTRTLDRESHPTKMGNLSALPGRIIDLIRDGAPRGERSGAAASIALSMVGHGWSYADFASYLMDETNGISDWTYWRRRGSRRSIHDVHARLRTTWDNAVRREQESPSVHDSTDVRHLITEMIVMASSWSFPSRTRLTDSLVLRALHDKAMTRGRLSVPMSLREMVEVTGIPLKTCSRGVSRLIEQGWLSIDTPHQVVETRSDQGELVLKHHARVYHLSTPTTNDRVLKTTHHPEGGPGREESVSLCAPSPAGHDVWSGRAKVNMVTGEVRAGGLGRYAHAVYEAMGDTAVSVSEVARRTGCSRNTVSKHLRALQGVGLAESTPEGWKRLLCDLDELAEAMGVKGRSEETVQMHRIEREMWSAVGGRIAHARSRRGGEAVRASQGRTHR